MSSKTNNTGTGSTLLLHEIIQQKLHKIGNHINLMMNRVLYSYYFSFITKLKPKEEQSGNKPKQLLAPNETER